MKGVILACMGKMVQEQFGADKWKSILSDAGMPGTTVFLAHQDVADEQVLKVVGSACEVLGIDLQQAADAFGDYWVNKFAPQIYSMHYQGVSNSREFLLKLDEVHKITTRTVPNAHPPRFDYERKDDQTLIMGYHSERNLMPFFLCLLRGVGKHFGEPLSIRELPDSRVEIVFPK